MPSWVLTVLGVERVRVRTELTRPVCGGGGLWGLGAHTQVSIDNDLVAQNLQAAESIVTMDNGCVCCTVRGDLIRALTELMEKSISKETQFDSVLIETTGLADPAPVASTFYSNPEVRATKPPNFHPNFSVLFSYP